MTSSNQFFIFDLFQSVLLHSNLFNQFFIFILIYFNQFFIFDLFQSILLHCNLFHSSISSSSLQSFSISSSSFWSQVFFFFKCSHHSSSEVFSSVHITHHLFSSGFFFKWSHHFSSFTMTLNVSSLIQMSLVVFINNVAQQGAHLPHSQCHPS